MWTPPTHAEDVVLDWSQDEGLGGYTTQTLTLTYGEELSLQPADGEHPAAGPDMIAAGQGGEVALHDSAADQIVLLDPDGALARFDVARVDGLLFPNPHRIVVLDGMARTLLIYGRSGRLLRERPIGDAMPAGARLEMAGSAVYVVDTDGARLEVARIVDGQIRPPARSRSSEPSVPIEASGDTVVVDGVSVTMPGAAHLSGQSLGGEPPWIELEAVQSGAGGVAVHRLAWQGGIYLPLPSGPRPYAPVLDAAVGFDGELVYLDPGEETIDVVWVEPL